MNLSIRNAFITLWALLFAVCVGLAFFLLELYEQSIDTQTRQTEELVQQAGESLSKRYATYIANSEVSFSNKVETVRELNLLLSLVLAQFDGIEGGFWTANDGFVAYGFPSYGDSKIKKDLPGTEASTIAEIAKAAVRSGGVVLQHFKREHRSLVIYAVPLHTSLGATVLWTMGWASVKNSELFQQLVIALTVLFMCSLLSGIWLCVFLYRWSTKLTSLKKSISNASIEELPQLNMTGQQELDEVVLALNQLSSKLQETKAISAKLSRELVRADRLNAVSRMVAGFAHEIRNPLAAIHLGAENALEGATGKQERLLNSILKESQALQGLLAELLSVAKLHQLKPSRVDLKDWLAQRIILCEPLAAKNDITLKEEAPDEYWSFDDENLSRAFNNLLLNAIQNTPAEGFVEATIAVGKDKCSFVVEDSGPGVPEDKREMIFEPLFTGRVNGVGLGLTIVREIVEAHGGRIFCSQGRVGARFEMEIPWLKS